MYNSAAQLLCPKRFTGMITGILVLFSVSLSRRLVRRQIYCVRGSFELLFGRPGRIATRTAETKEN